MKKGTDINNRFIEVFRYLEKQDIIPERKEAYAKLGITAQVLSEILSNRMHATKEVLQKLFISYNVNPYFIFLGQKPYINEQLNAQLNAQVNEENVNPIVNPIVEPSLKIQAFHESKAEYHRTPGIITIDKSGDDNIVLVEAKAAASYLKHYMEPHFFKKLPTFSVPGLRNGVYRGFQVKGNSMEPNFKDQDYVVGQFVDNYRSIREGYVHIVVTTEDIVIKRVLNRIEKRGKFVLISDNEDFDTYEVEAEDVKELWDFKMLISAKVPSRRHDFTRLISNLQADILELKDRLLNVERKK